MSYMGLDIGQTGCKAIIFNNLGNQLSHSYREYQTIIPEEGWAELDSKEVSEACFEVMREAQASCSEDPVRALGISSQGEAFTPIGPGGELSAHAMITFDTRAANITDIWSRRFGLKKLYNLTGHTAHPMFSLFKLLWLKENRSDTFKKTTRFLCFEDLLQYRLGIEPHIAWPLAGRTMMFNIKRHCWDKEILDAVGIYPSQLAVPVPSGTVVGRIPHSIAKSLGFSKDVSVVSAGHDQPLGALGAGIVSPGRAMYATGTSECITPVFSDPVLSEDLFTANICTYDYTLKGMYTTVAFSLTGGNILKWFRDEWGQAERREAESSGRNAYELILEKMGASPSGVLVLPYFTPSGTPYFDSEVSGAILGLHLATTREEILRGLLEGVAFEMLLNLEILSRSGIQIDELRAIGGGAKSTKWIQLKADVMNKPITRVKVTEAACFAAAMLSRAALTDEPISSIVKRWVKTEGIINPIPENADIYMRRFEKYKKLYPLMKELKL